MSNTKVTQEMHLIAQGIAEDGVLLRVTDGGKLSSTFYNAFALIWRRLRAPVELLSLTAGQHEASDQRPRKWCFRW